MRRFQEQYRVTVLYKLFSDLAQKVQPPDKGILSRTPFNDDRPHRL